MSGGPGAESFALVWLGDPIGLDVKFHFCDAAPTFIVTCYETSTRVSK